MLFPLLPVLLGVLSFSLSAMTLKFPRAFWTLILIGSALLGNGLYLQRWTGLQIEFPSGRTSVIGTVDSFPLKIRSEYDRVRTRISLGHLGIAGRDGQMKSHEGRIRVIVPSGFPVRVGDRVLLEGMFIRTRAARNPGGFDARLALERDGLSAHFLVRDDSDCRLISSGNGNPAVAACSRLRDRLESMVDESIPGPERGVVKALFLGIRTEVDHAVRDGFSRSGTAHILAISGSHVALLSAVLLALLKAFRLPRKAAIAGVMFFLIAYCVLVGSGASVTRATIMICVVLAGFLLRRESEILTSLSWAAILILAVDPLELFNTGFQLSFVSVFMLAAAFDPLVADPDGAGKDRSRWAWLLRRGVLTSATVWLGTLPLVARVFFLCSPVGILANVVLIPCLGILIGNGLAFFILGSVSGTLQTMMGSSLWIMTKSLILFARWCSSIPFGHFRVSPPETAFVLIFYAFLILWLGRGYLRLKPKHFLACLLFIMNVAVWERLFEDRDPRIRITFLDVGHGDSAVVEMPGGQVFLVDAGPGGVWDQGRMTVAPFLWSRGLKRIDGVILTHAHYDHYGGLGSLLRDFPVGTIFSNGDPGSQAYMKTVRQARNETLSLSAGDEIHFPEGAVITVLNPSRGSPRARGSPNDRSLVVRIRFRGFSALFGADIEERAMQRLNRLCADLGSDVLKVAHHGSDEGSAGRRFASLVRPKIAIISESERNRFHLPAEATVRHLRDLGARVYQTGLTGAVEVESDGLRFTVRTMEDLKQNL